jgi:hypothetical protein
MTWKAKVLISCVGALALMFLVVIPVGVVAGGKSSLMTPSAGSLFLLPVTYDTGGIGAGGVAIGDVNGDGKPDIALGTANGLAVLLGKGDGTFQLPVFYGTKGSGGGVVVIADMNGDGVPDLVAVNAGSCGSHANGCVAVLIGNGNGTFGTAKTYDAGGPSSYSMAVADFNGDGKLDVVVTDCSPYSGAACGIFGVLMGRGDGTLSKVVTHNSGGVGAWSVTTGDVNHDGKVDVVIGNLCQDSLCDGDGYVSIFLGRGNGTFRNPISYTSAGRTLVPAIADINGDGNPDIVVANGAGNEGVGVLMGNGDGTFQPVVIYKAGEKFVSSLKLGDVNGDGYVDVVVADCAMGQYVCQVTASVSVLLGNGDGTFQEASTYSSGGQTSNMLAIADLNGDGYPDIAVTNCSPEGTSCDGTQDGVLGVLLNSGTSH